MHFVVEIELRMQGFQWLALEGFWEKRVAKLDSGLKPNMPQKTTYVPSLCPLEPTVPRNS